MSRDPLSWTTSKRVIARCVHCRRFFRERDHYMVRNAVWAAAGMDNYQAGYLHMRCLEERLGRKLTGADMLARHTKAGIEIHPDYLDSPEMALGDSGLDGATTAFKMLWRTLVDSGKLTAREAENYGLDVDARYAYVPTRDASSPAGWVLTRYQWRFDEQQRLLLEPPSIGGIPDGTH